MSLLLSRLLDQAYPVRKRLIGLTIATEVLLQARALDTALSVFGGLTNAGLTTPPDTLTSIINSPLGVSIAYYRLVGGLGGIAGVGSAEAKSVLTKIQVPRLDESRVSFQHFVTRWHAAWPSLPAPADGTPEIPAVYPGFYNSLIRA